MTLNVNSAFFDRLQGDSIEGLVELVDLTTPNGSFHWVTRNEPLLATFSGANIVYDPFPGETTPAGARNTELAVSAARFAFGNSGDLLNNIILGREMMRSQVRIRRVWADTPGLDEWIVFDGTVQDVQHNRDVISGQVRDKMAFVKRQWPPYVYQDTCIWRFGNDGCGVDVSSFTDTISPAQLTVGSSSRGSLFVTTSRGDDFFSLGRATCVGGTNSGSIRQIRSHSGSAILLSHPLAQNPGSSDVWELQAGCRKRLIADCTSKFNNVNSGQTTGYAGFPWIPIQDNAY